MLFFFFLRPRSKSLKLDETRNCRPLFSWFRRERTAETTLFGGGSQVHLACPQFISLSRGRRASFLRGNRKEYDERDRLKIPWMSSMVFWSNKLLYLQCCLIALFCLHECNAFVPSGISIKPFKGATLSKRNCRSLTIRKEENNSDNSDSEGVTENAIVASWNNYFAKIRLRNVGQIGPRENYDAFGNIYLSYDTPIMSWYWHTSRAMLCN